MPVGEMLTRISSREFAEWQAYYKLEAFGPSVQEQQLAMMSWLFAEAWSDPKKGRRLSPQDFMVTQATHRPRKQGWKEQLEIVKMLAKATGTKLIQGNV
jgi:hypothetical protein